jgi:hypothetical protein
MFDKIQHENLLTMVLFLQSAIAVAPLDPDLISDNIFESFPMVLINISVFTDSFGNTRAGFLKICMKDHK